MCKRTGRSKADSLPQFREMVCDCLARTVARLDTRVGHRVTILAVEVANHVFRFSYVEPLQQRPPEQCLGHITPTDMLAGRHAEIQAERDRKLEEAS